MGPYSRYTRQIKRVGKHRPNGQSFRQGWLVMRQRWSNAMPKFFRIVCWVCALVSGTALAVNTAITAGGGVPHEWWTDIYPYLLGIPAGAAFVAKFTQNYDRNGNPIKKALPGGNQPSAVNNSDVETVSPDDDQT